MSSADQRPVSIGIIGFGARLKYVLSLLKASAGAAVQVRHVASRSEGARSAAATLDDRPMISADYQPMLADQAVSWVLIGSINADHREQAVAALRAGKNVFCEKPVGSTLEDCAAIQAAHAVSGRQFVVGFVLRYAPLYRRIVSLIRSGAIGRLVSLEFNETLDFNHGGFIMSNWRRHQRLSGGHLLEKCSHDIDIVNWIVDSPATRVASFGGRSFFTPEHAFRRDAIGADDQGRPAYAGWGVSRDGADPFVLDNDLIDHQHVLLEYANGVNASFHTNLNCGLPERRLYLVGTEGAIRADVLHGTIELRRIGHNEPTILHDLRDAAGMHGGGDRPMADELFACMTHAAETATPLSTGILAAVTCLAADLARTRGTVLDVRTIWPMHAANAAPASN